MVRTKDDETFYFVLNTWEDTPAIFFVRRNHEGAKELARVEMPEDLKAPLLEANSLSRGVFAVDGKLREWLRHELDAF